MGRLGYDELLEGARDIRPGISLWTIKAWQDEGLLPEPTRAKIEGQARGRAPYRFPPEAETTVKSLARWRHYVSGSLAAKLWLWLEGFNHIEFNDLDLQTASGKRMYQLWRSLQDSLPGLRNLHLLYPHQYQERIGTENERDPRGTQDPLLTDKRQEEIGDQLNATFTEPAAKAGASDHVAAALSAVITSLVGLPASIDETVDVNGDPNVRGSVDSPEDGTPSMIDKDFAEQPPEGLSKVLAETLAFLMTGRATTNPMAIPASDASLVALVEESDLASIGMPFLTIGPRENMSGQLVMFDFEPARSLWQRVCSLTDRRLQEDITTARSTIDLLQIARRIAYRKNPLDTIILLNHLAHLKEINHIMDAIERGA